MEMRKEETVTADSFDVELSDEAFEENDTVQSAVKLYFREIRGKKILDGKEQMELAKKIETTGIAARNELVKANLALVVSVAKKYQGRGIELEDLIQEGNIGLIKATELYNPYMNIKFSTYANYWIVQAISRSIANKSRAIRIPIHKYHSFVRIQKKEGQLFAEKGRKPNDFELAESTGEKVKNIQDYRIYFNSLVSMDAPVAGDQDLDYSEVLSDPQALSVEEEVEKEELSELISKLMEHLTPKEKYVITKRFGLDGGKPQTYLEISKGIKVSREYVRQLKNRAIEKMKNSRNKLPLEEYWA